MKNQFRRLIAVLMAAALTFGNIPTPGLFPSVMTVEAAETDQTSGGTVTEGVPPSLAASTSVTDGTINLGDEEYFGIASTESTPLSNDEGIRLWVGGANDKVGKINYKSQAFSAALPKAESGKTSYAAGVVSTRDALSKLTGTSPKQTANFAGASYNSSKGTFTVKAGKAAGTGYAYALSLDKDKKILGIVFSKVTVRVGPAAVSFTIEGDALLTPGNDEELLYLSSIKALDKNGNAITDGSATIRLTTNKPSDIIITCGYDGYVMPS